MPPKRKNKVAPPAAVSAGSKRTRLSATTATDRKAMRDGDDMERDGVGDGSVVVSEELVSNGRGNRQNGATTKRDALVPTVRRARGTTRKAQARTSRPTPTATNQKGRKGDHVFDMPSSDDHLAGPVATSAIVAGASTPAIKRRNGTTVTYKTPSRLQSSTTKVLLNDRHSDESFATGERLDGDGKATTTITATPKTLTKNLKPPRTRKKGTSAPPKTGLQGKMGVGVPGGGEEVTPSSRKKTIADMNTEEDTQDVKIIDAHPNVDLEKGAVGARSVKKTRPSVGRPSLGTEGLVDPFAVPAEAMDIDVNGPEEAMTVPSKTPVTTIKTVKKTSKITRDAEITEEAVECLKYNVLGKLMTRKRLDLVGLDDEYNNVHHLLEQTVTAGEGNSMLVVGARGSGKTTLVENALDDLRAAHSGEFHVVRLNGLLQTDDKQALREIWRQLGVEMELDENEQPKQTNFADTLQSILAVLSHPDELQQPEEEGGGQQDYQDGDGVEKTAMAVVFILDEFDQFAIHPRQTLLYNLFDIAQAKKAPIAVIGLTCRVNIVDRLEKRVKSRFSHRTVHLKLPSTLEEFWAVVRQGLIVDPLDPTTTTANGTTEEYFSEWNSYIDTILRPSPQFTNLLTSTYTISKTPVPIFNALLIPFSNITPSDPFPASESLENSTPSFKAPHPTLSLLPSLSDLQLSLLIAAARLEVLADTDAVTFEMVYDEYLKLVSKVRVNGTPGGGAAGGVGRVWGRSLAVAAWEGMVECALIIDATRGGGTGGTAVGGKKVAGKGGLWRIEVGLEEVREYVKGTAWARWCREVV